MRDRSDDPSHHKLLMPGEYLMFDEGNLRFHFSQSVST